MGLTAGSGTAQAADAEAATEHRPYDYSTRKGVRPISWQDFHGICKALALAASRFDPQIVLPIGRGGYYPGTLIAHMLEVDVHPIRLSRRVRGVPTYDTPRWLVRPPKRVKGRRVLVVDEISGTGETLAMVKHEVEKLGAQAVKIAVLYAHTWGVEVPNYIGIISDELIMNPWDREIVKDGEFRLHPEYEGALKEQGLPLDPSLLIEAETTRLAKG